MKKMLVMLMLAFVAGAALDQSYVQTIARDGGSTIQKMTDLSVFANLLPEAAFSKMAGFCSNTTEMTCSMDIKAKKITITDSFQPGEYYTVTTEYDLFSVTRTITVARIPTDRFAADLDNVLLLSGVVGTPQESNVKVLDLNDRQANAENAATLRTVKANITYTTVMPGEIVGAGAGSTGASVSGNKAAFDLVAIMAHSAPLVVVTREPNYVSIVAMTAIIVMGALALSFFKAPKRGGRKKKSG